jgi:hypothetical protein
MRKILMPLFYGVISGLDGLPFKAAITYTVYHLFFSESPTSIAHSTVIAIFLIDFVVNTWAELRAEFEL